MTILAETLTRILRKRVSYHPEYIAFKRKVNGVWEEVTFLEYRNFVEEICYALMDLGIERGDRVAIQSNTRMEWALADFGILSVGAITVPIYQSNLEPEVEWILNNSEAKTIFVEDKIQLTKILSVKPRLPKLKYIIIFDHPSESFSDIQCMTLEELCQRGRHYKDSHQLDFDKLLEAPNPQDVASIVYTSGTTGVPKGVVLTHENFISELTDIVRAFPLLSENDTVLTFLPYAHILARIEHYAGLVVGWTAALAESIPKMTENLSEVRPTFMIAVPRIYEKVYNKVLGQVAAGSSLKKKIFYWSLNIGKRVSQRTQANQALTPFLRFQYRLAKMLVFNKIKKKFGGRIRFFLSGGAPLSKDIAEFFHAVGFLILEGYGLTETTAAVFSNRENNYEFGTVGLPLKDVQVKIVEDGEILIKSKKVFKEYYKNPEATKETFKEGWYCTGDIGFLNEHGRLKITDRKKDIIVTSAGKNVAPQKIENLLKTDPYISQAMVFGDKKHYLTALITLSQEEVQKFAETHHIPQNGNFVDHPEIQKLIRNIIEATNKMLPSFETIKKFKILKNDFSIETGELTPSLKIKRKFCTDKYQDTLNSMYEEGGRP